MIDLSGYSISTIGVGEIVITYPDGTKRVVQMLLPDDIDRHKVDGEGVVIKMTVTEWREGTCN